MDLAVGFFNGKILLDIWLACFLPLEAPYLKHLTLANTQCPAFFKREKMFLFKIKSPVGKVSKKHLHSYQARTWQVTMVSAGGPGFPERFDWWSLWKAGEAVGYTVNCMDGSFEVHEWCLYNSDILLTLHQGMIYNKEFWLKIGRKKLKGAFFYWQSASEQSNFISNKAKKNFEERGNKAFDLKKFRKAPIKIVFDALHGISTDYVKLPAGIHNFYPTQKFINWMNFVFRKIRGSRIFRSLRNNGILFVWRKSWSRFWIRNKSLS